MRACWLIGAALLLAAGTSAAASRLTATSPDGTPQRLVLALDGIPYDLFADLQRRGHFAGFRPAARMVSTFPSLSEVAFSAIGGGEPPDGYQYTHYDPVQNKVVGHTISSLSGRAHPKIAADSEGDSISHRVMGYVSSNRTALADTRQIARELLLSHKETFVAYVGSSDAVLHLQGRAGAEKLLLGVDETLRDLQDEVRRRTGRELQIDLVSDHGSTPARGRIVALKEVLGKCGFRRSRRLLHANDVVYPLPGIVGSVAVSTAASQVEPVARCLAAAEGIDLVAVDRGDAVGILTADGEAEVRSPGTVPEAYDYRDLRGDPLQLLPTTVLSVAAREQRFDAGLLFRQTIAGSRPDPLRRLWRAFHGSVRNGSPILLSLKDGYEAGNPILLALAGLRGRAGTHGSMTQQASLGVLASNWRDVADVDAWTARDVLFGETTLAAMRRARDEVQPPAHSGR